MKQYGFTLVELLAIIVLLSLIFALTFPSLLSMNKRQNNKEYETIEKTLCMAGETYIYSHIRSYKSMIESSTETVFNISVDTLIQYDNVDKSMKIKDKCTGQSVNVSGYLTFIVLEDKTLSCTYSEIRKMCE